MLSVVVRSATKELLCSKRPGVNLIDDYTIKATLPRIKAKFQAWQYAFSVASIIALRSRLEEVFVQGDSFLTGSFGAFLIFCRLHRSIHFGKLFSGWSLAERPPSFVSLSHRELDIRQMELFGRFCWNSRPRSMTARKQSPDE